MPARGDGKVTRNTWALPCAAGEGGAGSEQCIAGLTACNWRQTKIIRAQNGRFAAVVAFST